MKNHSLLKSVLSASALSFGFAFAGEHGKDESHVNPYGFLEVDTTLMDSSSDKGISFALNKATVGLRTENGDIKTDIAFELLGGAGGGEDDDTLSGIKLYRAQMDLNLHNSDTANTTLSVGGIRPDGAVSYGAVHETYANGYERMDGIRIKQGLHMQNMHLGIGFGIYNTLNVYTSKVSDLGMTNSLNKDLGFSKGTAQKDKAMLVEVNAGLDMGHNGVYFNMGYGMQKNAQLKTLTNPLPGNAADTNHMEMSLDFRMGDQQKPWMAVGGWYEANGLTFKMMTLNSKNIPEYKTDGVTVKKRKNTAMGFGLRGTSEPFLHGFWKKDDCMTYAFAYTAGNSRTESPSNDSLKDYDSTAMNFAAGYKLAQMSMELSYNMYKTKKATAYNDGSDLRPEKMKKELNTVVLAAVYNFE